jgi:uncharacterized protein YggE
VSFAHLATAVAAAAVLGGAPALAQDSTERSIAVTGSASRTAANDRAGFSTGVQVRRSSPAVALRHGSALMYRVLAAIEAQGIARRDIRTQRVDVRKLVERRRKDGPTTVVYVATNTVSVTVRAIGDTGAVMDAAIGGGANRLNGPWFWRSSKAGLYRQALVLALRKARRKGETLATEAGVALGAVLTIRESGADVVTYDASRAYSYAAPAPLPVASLIAAPIRPGRTRVTADLTAVFAIS